MQTENGGPVIGDKAHAGAARSSEILRRAARGLPAHLARALEIFLWAGFFALAIAFLALRYSVLPNVERYREDIAAAVSQTVGLRVTIGALEASWPGLWPELVLSDVRVYDRDGREALVLPAVENVVSWRSILHRDLRLHSLAIEGPRLTLRRDPQGVITVAGIRVEGDAGEGALADWVLAQREIEIRNAEIDWVDELRGAPPLALSNLNFRLRNRDYEHSFGLSARPPAELGSALELRGELSGRAVSELKTWNGKVFAELGYTDLAGWRAWLDYPLDVRKGEGAVRLWATFVEGKVRRATADLALTGVVAQLGKDLPVMELPSVSGRLHGRDTERGYEFGARSLAVVSGRGPDMQATSFRVSWDREAEGRAQHGALSANLIELAPLAHLAEFVPFPAELRRLLAELAPGGNLLDARLEWSGELPDAASYSLKTRFAGLQMKAWRSVPGFSGLSGNIDASETRGVLHLVSRKSALDLPKVFPEPRIALDALGGEIRWERKAGGALAVRISGLGFENEDLAGTAQGTYASDGTSAGTIDVSAQLSRANGKQIARYLPLESIMGAAARAWVVTSVLDAKSSDVSLRLKGDLRDFPFTDASKGIFQVAAKFAGGVLDYANGWPRIEGIDGELLFEREKMLITGRSGSILGARIGNVRASIANLLAERTLLVINGSAEGPTAEFLKYIQRSPVREMVDGLTDGMSAQGNGKLQLKLELPLEDLEKTRIAGEYQFQNNTTTVDPRLPPIERASARIGFTESALTVHEGRGQLFGGPVTVSGGTSPEAGAVLVARGEAPIAGVRALIDHPLRARIAGSLPYAATISVKGARTQIAFESSLRGMAIDLPPPLAKRAADALPLRVDLFPADDRDRISLALGKLVAAEFLRVKKGSEMQVQRTAVALSPAPGEALRLPERPGTLIYGSLPALDLDRWLPLFSGGGADAQTRFELRFGTLDVIGKRLHNAVVRGGADTAGWSANVSASELAGDLAYRAEGKGLLTARLSHLRIPDDYPGAKPVEGVRELPSVDLIAESFTHRGKRYGRVEVAALHDGPNWRIDKLALVNPEASISGGGLWRSGAGSKTTFNLRVEAGDVGKFLERLGYADRVQGASAKVEGKLEWNGDPFAIDYPSLTGALSLNAEKGQFPSIESGFGRVLSLISLNVNDATAKGFSFDTISASFQIARGVMSTNDLKIRGSAAEVTLNGDFDLERETQKLRIKVVPSMRRGVTTLATIVNPAVAVGVAIAQNVLKDPIGQILSYEYDVSGSWDEPKVEKIEPVPPPAAGAITSPP